MSGSTPSWSRKKPIGVFFFKPKVSATLLTYDGGLVRMCYGNNMILKNQFGHHGKGVEVDIYLTLGVATAQGGVDEDEQDGEGGAGEGEEDAVELVHHKAEGGDEDYSFICCFSFALEA